MIGIIASRPRGPADPNWPPPLFSATPAGWPAGSYYDITGDAYWEPATALYTPGWSINTMAESADFPYCAPYGVSAPASALYEWVYDGGWVIRPTSAFNAFRTTIEREPNIAVGGCSFIEYPREAFGVYRETAYIPEPPNPPISTEETFFGRVSYAVSNPNDSNLNATQAFLRNKYNWLKYVPNNNKRIFIDYAVDVLQSQIISDESTKYTNFRLEQWAGPVNTYEPPGTPNQSIYGNGSANTKLGRNFVPISSTDTSVTGANTVIGQSGTQPPSHIAVGTAPPNAAVDAGGPCGGPNRGCTSSLANYATRIIRIGLEV